jgi:pyruvate,orthophosphate dikinase
VVAGIRTPQDITEGARKESGSDKPSMEIAMPEAFKELTRIYTLLEKHYRDMQDIEFTVEQGKLWMLQTRNGKRTAKAALRIAVELAKRGPDLEEDAVRGSIRPRSTSCCIRPSTPRAKRDVIATGLPASPGAASGEIVFSSDEAASAAGRRAQGHPGADRDQPGRHPRHARRRRHPDHARRHDLARRRGRARHGQALRLRRGASASITAAAP